MARTNEQRRRYYWEHREEILSHQRRYWREHKEERTANNKKYSQSVKREVFTHYCVTDNPICARCGISDIDILCLDHINGDGNEHRRSLGTSGKSGFYFWLRRNSYPEGFQVLCFNCNQKKKITEGESMERIFGGKVL